ncbi:hypothetical protein Leryth_018637 [Lithospermum erythrorhizon]|nr:hypothetical protein Leryth_018637 [Lithospermum erythrorhizon]
MSKDYLRKISDLKNHENSWHIHKSVHDIGSDMIHFTPCVNRRFSKSISLKIMPQLFFTLKYFLSFKFI